MINFQRLYSTTGIVFAALFLSISIIIFYVSRDARGEGAVLQLFLTFPWFFFSLGWHSIPLWVWIIPNAIVSYLAGFGIERLFKKIFFS